MSKTKKKEGRKSKIRKKEREVYSFGKESGTSSEENMEAASKPRDIEPLGTKKIQIQEPVDEDEKENPDKTRKDEFKGTSTRRNVNEIGMRIQDESREEKSTNPEHEPMIDAIYQEGEQTKINNLLNF